MAAISLPGERRSGPGFGLLTALLAAAFFVSIPACWALGHVYGVDRRDASNIFYIVFILVYVGIIALPWLNLRGQEGLDREQRLGKSCVAWLCLEIAAACFWSGPWLLFPSTIVAGRGAMWSYGWWAYMDGGDARYTVTDAALIAMERMGIIAAVAAAVVLIRRLVNRRFSDRDLAVLMFTQAAEFGVICVYFLSAFYLDLRSLGGPSEIAIKYVGSNLCWLFLPPVVCVWAGRMLIARGAFSGGHRDW